MASAILFDLGRRRRLPRFLEVGGRAEHRSARSSDLAGHHRGVGERAHLQCHVDPFRDQVDIVVVEDRFHRELRMRCEEQRQTRDDGVSRA